MDIGDILFGICDGLFGVEFDGEKTVEGFGEDWIVVREDTGEILIAVFEDENERDFFFDKWSREEDEEDFFEEELDLDDDDY